MKFVVDSDGSAPVDYALGRRPDRTYLATSFVMNRPSSRDHGQPARYITKVFDAAAGDSLGPEVTTERYVLHTSKTGRVQTEVLVASEAGIIREVKIQKVELKPGGYELQNVATLDREGARKLSELMRAIEHLPVQGETTVRIDDDLLKDVLDDQGALRRLYGRDPEQLRRLIQDDSTARDLLALAHRREQLARFHSLLEEPAYFATELRPGQGPEKVWQLFFEQNPWILGVSLAGQLLTSFDERKLEQTTVGASVTGPGKRVDALMATSGRLMNLVFAEIKHHETKLLDYIGEKGVYRSGCWAPSSELGGGIVQIQQTVELSMRHIQDAGLRGKDKTGADAPQSSYGIRPRSYLIIGRLDELCGPTGEVNTDQHRSFELFRRNLYEPEVITYDELLARATWHVEAAAQAEAPQQSPEASAMPVRQRESG